MTLARKQIEKLPPFITTTQFGRLINRSQTYIDRRIKDKILPPRQKLPGMALGWPKEVIVEWLKQHPEAFNV